MGNAKNIIFGRLGKVFGILEEVFGIYPVPWNLERLKIKDSRGIVWAAKNLIFGRVGSIFGIM